jgi:putative glutamine amidotransferase
MSRPVLGISCCTRTIGSETAQAVIDRYVVNTMRHADCAALLVPALPELMRAEEVADRLDGVLLTGSPSNLDPARYGDPDPDAEGPWDPARDAMTAALIAAMIARGKPVIGVCRGFQEINAALGGTLRRDTSASPELLRHHVPDGTDFAAMFDHCHDVALTPGGLLARAYGRDTLSVNSVHYQGVGRLAPGLAIEAQSPDGLVEAVSATIAGAAVLAVQWHPEWATDAHPDSQLFFRLVGRMLRGETQ